MSDSNQIRESGGTMKLRRFFQLGLLLATSVPAFAGEADVPNTAESIKKGQGLYMTLCTECHGRNGKAQIDVVSDATNLTDPALYRNGSSDAAIYKSIKDGAGAGMPPYADVLKSEADIGNLRNFIKSWWPEAKRPPVVK
jgi:mono/diheme cytochrome c family protein